MALWPLWKHFLYRRLLFIEIVLGWVGVAEMTAYGHAEATEIPLQHE